MCFGACIIHWIPAPALSFEGFAGMTNSCCLVEFPRLFVFGVLAALAAIFTHLQFFRRVDFIPVADVILAFADRTHKSKEFALIFFGHGGIIPYFP